MPNQVRTTTQLLDFLKDNTGGEISAQDVRDVIVSTHGVYGMLGHFNASPAQITLNGSINTEIPLNDDGPMGGGVSSLQFGSVKRLLIPEGIYLAIAHLSVGLSGGSVPEYEVGFAGPDPTLDLLSHLRTRISGSGSMQQPQNIFMAGLVVAASAGSQVSLAFSPASSGTGHLLDIPAAGACAFSVHRIN